MKKQLNVTKVAATLSNAIKNSLKGEQSLSKNLKAFIQAEANNQADTKKILAFPQSLELANATMINLFDAFDVNFTDLVELHKAMSDTSSLIFKARKCLLNSFRNNLKTFDLVLKQKDSGQKMKDTSNNYWSGHFHIVSASIDKRTPKAKQSTSLSEGNEVIPISDAIKSISSANKQSQIEALKALASELKLSKRDILTAFFGTVDAAKMEAAIASKTAPKKVTKITDKVANA